MRGFWPLAVLLGLGLWGANYLYSQHAEQKERAQLLDELSEAREQFVERAQIAINHDRVEAYRASIQTALTEYEERVTKIYADRPEWLDLEIQKALVDETLQDGKISEAQHRRMLEGHEFAKEAYETLRLGQWTSDLSQRGEGGTRLDVYDLKRIQDPDGNPLLEAQFFLWGIKPKTPVSFGGMTLKYWHQSQKKSRSRQRRRGSQSSKWSPLGQAEGDASPIVFIQDPSRQIAQFPSYVSIGTLWFPQVPREAEVMDLSYGYTVRRMGQAHRSQLTWEKMSIPPSWRLSEDEPWLADEVETTEEELEDMRE